MPETHLPRVTIHYAQTLDGRTATRTGHSQWISGEASLRLAHKLRASHAAVMVGVGTVVADNPSLTVRLAHGPSPRRVIVDSVARLPLDSNVLTDHAAPTILATTERASPGRLAQARATGAAVYVVPEDATGRVDLREALHRLWQDGLHSVLIEGGSALITSALGAGLVQRVVVCIAPKIVGVGVEAIGDLGINHLNQALTFTQTRIMPLGDDLIFDGELTVSGAVR